MDKLIHDILTGTDKLRQLCNAGVYKHLRVVCPHIRTVTEPGNSHKVGKAYRFCFHKHFAYEFCSEFRYTEGAHGRTKLLRRYTQSLR